ncbi:MAG: pentapeptide repeat-containing protein [Azospirillaceae bacterium]|nr:pentapeptide repeat-containing protein [Azospirillaceae bacterium]
MDIESAPDRNSPPAVLLRENGKVKNRGLTEGESPQISLFDQRDMVATTSPDFPGERLIIWRNPDLDRERATLSGANLRRVGLARANLSMTRVYAVPLVRGGSWPANFEGAVLAGADLSGAQFDGVILRNADLTGCVMKNVSMRNVDLQHAKR